MSEAVTLRSHFYRISQQLHIGSGLNKITHMGFGDGGHDTLTFLALHPSDVADSMNNEIYRKEITGSRRIDVFNVEYFVTLNKLELGGSTFSEFAIFDEAGNMVAWKNTEPRIKVDGKVYSVSITLRNSPVVEPICA